MGEGLRLLEQREREDKAKLKWLRGAVSEGFDAIKRGDYVEVNSEQELDAFLGKIRAEVTNELATDPRRD